MDNSIRRKKLGVFLVLAVFSLLAVFPGQGFGQSSRINVNTTVAAKLNLTVHKSLVLDDPGPGNIVFASAAPEIVEVMRLPTGQIYLRGLAPGITNISILEKDKVTAIFDIEVAPDITRLQETLTELFPAEKDLRLNADNDRLTLYGAVSSPGILAGMLAVASAYYPEKITNLVHVPAGAAPTTALKEKIHELLPEEKDVHVTRMGDKITLSGTVSSAENLTQILYVGGIFAGGADKVLNLLKVGGVHQVMLEVRVAEMSRGLTRRLGVNFGYLSDSGQNFGAVLPGNLSSFSSDVGEGGEGSITGTASATVNAIFRFFGFDASWTVFIDAMKETGLVKILAEPNLITTSGQSAEFLAGGEFPIPVPANDGNIAIEYKPFGVGLSFTPIVLSDDRISIRVSPEVSEIDYSTAVASGGVAVPGLTQRRLSTTIELADGQSFAIGGLLQQDAREIVNKFPVLGDIPILGNLFRSQSFQKNETELIIIATVHLVKPIDMTQQPLPTDEYVEPDDFEFYLLGRIEGVENAQPSVAAGGNLPEGGLEGDFGHIVPQ